MQTHGLSCWGVPEEGGAPYQENWTERDIFLSLIGPRAPAASFIPFDYTQDHPGYVTASTLGQFITPLSAATLNGRTMQEVCATAPPQELPGRIKVIEEEVYDGYNLHSHYSPTTNQRQGFHHNSNPAMGFHYPSQPYVTNDHRPQSSMPVQNPGWGNQILPHRDPTEQHKMDTSYTQVSRKRVAQDEPYAKHDNSLNGNNLRATSQSQLTFNHEAIDDDCQQTASKKVKSEPFQYAPDDQDDGKDLDKAMRSRESSRRYRQRKKECFEKMKQQLETFESEKRQLLKEREASMKAIESLKAENESLKNRNSVEALKFREERLALLAELSKLVKREASDEELIPTLTAIKERCQGIKQVSQALLRQYISPDAASYLAGIGFFREIDAIEVDRPSKGQSLYSFGTKLKAQVTDITEEQKQKIDALIEKFYGDISKLVHERKILAKELNTLYDAEPLIPESSPGGTAEQPDTSLILERLSSLQQLRENLITESDLSLVAISDMLDVLKPMQAAKFLVKAHFVHTAVMQLQMIWEALKTTSPSNSN